MRRRTFLNLFCAQSGAAILVCSSSGCGMIFHPERRGQPHSHHIDWQVAALDGLGLLLFFVPGVIAFAVDFYTGTIYLPHHEVHPHYSSTDLQRLSLPEGNRSVPEIERVVSNHLQQPIDLQTDEARVSELAGMDEFDSQRQHHEKDAGFGHSIKAFFAKRIG